MKKIISIVFVAFFSISAFAQTKINGIYYNLDDNTKTASVANKASDLYKGDIVIPETVSAGYEYTVTEIGEGAFNYCKELTAVTLPNTIKSIGSDAFYLATSLTSIVIPASVENWGSHIFNGSGITVIYLLATVPPTVGAKTFQNFAVNNVTLNVPESCDVAYNADATWSQFKEIIAPACSEPVETAIETISVRATVSVVGKSISVTNAKNVAVYNVMGGCVGKSNITTVTNAGVYFIVADGKSYKVVVK